MQRHKHAWRDQRRRRSHTYLHTHTQSKRTVSVSNRPRLCECDLCECDLCECHEARSRSLHPISLSLSLSLCIIHSATRSSEKCEDKGCTGSTKRQSLACLLLLRLSLCCRVTVVRIPFGADGTSDRLTNTRCICSSVGMRNALAAAWAVA